MNSAFLSVLDDDLQPGAGEDAVSARAGIGIFVENPLNRRLIESASVQLELDPKILNYGPLDFAALGRLEMIVADCPVARRIRTHFASREEQGEGIHPAVVAVMELDSEGQQPAEENNLNFDGVLWVPKAPAAVAAQLSLILYSHRAFARRYQNALDELNLNRRIFRSVTSGISVANAQLPHLPLTYVNPAFEVMTGYSLEEVLGRNCRFLQGKERDQPALALVREAIRDGREALVVLKNFRKDGTPFWNELSLSPIRNREGEVTHFVGIQTDVTARVEFEAALRESEKLAAVGRLASSIAHEINNPLEAVMNLLYLAEHAGDSAEMREYLSIADRELQRVKLITSQSLRFYKQSTKPQATAARELINSVLDVYQTRIQNANVKVERRERSTQSIVCMESEIRQVLSNLVSNALDAMQGRGGRLLVRSREATEARSGVRGILITVADTGGGMSEETLRDIYKAFYTTKGIGGTGLGLWISSEIVARHHGRLFVRSSQRPGCSGTVFGLFLPYQGFAMSVD